MKQLLSKLSSADLTLLSSWSAIGVGAALDNGTSYTAAAVALVTVGTVLLVLAVAARQAPAPGLGQGLGAAIAVVIAVLVAVKYPAGIFGSGAELVLSRTVTIVVAIVVALWLLLRLPGERLIAYGAVLVMAFAGVAMVLSSPKPTIDVWYGLQAAANGLSHGQNLYTLRWTGPPSQLSNGYVYLPGTAVLLWPFHVLFGDVRYGLIAALALTSLILIRVSGRSTPALLGCLVILYPKALFSLESSYIDPLILLALCAMAYAVVRGRYGWAVVTFAAALTFKQTVWILLPLALVWKDFGWRRTTLSVVTACAFMLPWAVAAPHAFYVGVLSEQLHFPAAFFGLSLFGAALHRGLHPSIGLTVVATLYAVALAVWKLPRNTFGFLLGSALVIAVFDLASKETFFNGWQLAAGLTLAAAVFGGALTNQQPTGQETQRLRLAEAGE